MSQGFKLKYDDWQSGKQTRSDAGDGAGSRAFDETYPDPGHGRYICFVWPDGKRITLNYTYLVSIQFAPESSNIALSFTTHDIALTGVNLQTLFYDLMDQRIRQVTCVDARYNIIGDNENPIVNEITLNENK